MDREISKEQRVREQRKIWIKWGGVENIKSLDPLL